MIVASLRAITGRRGSFIGGAAAVLAAVLIVLAVVVIVHELRPGRNPSIGGRPLFDGAGGAILLLGTVVAILVGSLAGSYDVAQGTMRYLVITGARRRDIYVARSLALVVAVLLVLAVPLVLAIVASLLLPHTDGDAIGLRQVGSFLWTTILWAVVFALISMGIGSVTRSNGPAIAISLFFAIGFTPLLLLISSVSKTLGDLTLIAALARVTGDDSSVPIPIAGLSVVAWIAVFWVAGWLRVLRDEY